MLFCGEAFRLETSSAWAASNSMLCTCKVWGCAQRRQRWFLAKQEDASVKSMACQRHCTAL